jgi:hypothetical protein
LPYSLQALKNIDRHASNSSIEELRAIRMQARLIPLANLSATERGSGVKRYWPYLAALNGEPAGTRTQDPMIKSHVLYRLSYGLGAPLSY